jgi:hypothetical protein
VTVISLAAFVIEANDANPIDNINGPVLKAMISRRHRLGYFPNHNFQDGTIRVDVLDGGD